MKTVIEILSERVASVMEEVTGRSDCQPIVKSATDDKFGDYQANGVMALAGKLGQRPRELAEKITAKLQLADICEPPEVAGPGFINIRLKPDFVAERLLGVQADSDNRFGIDKAAQAENIVVDFSCPNIAKQMHVGHLRSTIIGDSICRMLEFLGHKVIRQNHIGDWGTQFGMLVTRLLDRRVQSASGEDVSKIADTEDLYREAKGLFDSDPDFAQRARDNVVALQKGNEGILVLWRNIVDMSLKEIQKIYDQLSIILSKEDVRGESFYKDMLSGVVAGLEKRGLAVESDGAVCVFPKGFKNREGEPLPFIIQKSDGAYLYATTDLAAIRYRVAKLQADRIVYVTDARQSLHFQMLFAVAKMANWVSDDIELAHVMFGSVLGEDGSPLKTRSGENVKLKELLDEAIERAKAVVEEKNPDLPPKKKDQIAKAVGIGAVKYADFSNNRTSDYIFSFDKMLSLEGNTAPYMQYAYARIKSIERKAQSRDVDIETELAGIKKLILTDPAEVNLAKCLIRYGQAVQAAASDYRPNYLTAYLYELAQKFSAFYTNCPVLDSEAETRASRLVLCDLTAKTIKHGLSQLLGIKVVEQM